jgi:FMN phosphatase YigB (HAD superfamily)
VNRPRRDGDGGGGGDGDGGRGIRVVCFDLGGVLVRICRSWPEACGVAGIDVRGESAGEAHGLARQQLMDRFGTGALNEAEWVRRLSTALGACYSVDELMRIHHAWTRAEYEGAARLIDDLHDAGIPTACLSNTNHSHWARLVHHDGQQALAGAPEYPAVMRLRQRFASHLMGLAKPDPAIYRAFEKATGWTGRQILFFDDLPENVAAARAVGWNAELVDPHTETVPQLRSALARHHLL